MNRVYNKRIFTKKLFTMLSITQIITESLPISSSSHMKLVQYLFRKIKNSLTRASYQASLLNTSISNKAKNKKIICNKVDSICLSESVEHLMHIPTIIIIIAFLFIILLSKGYYSRDTFLYRLLLIMAANTITVLCYIFLKIMKKIINMHKNYTNSNYINRNYFSLSLGLLITLLLLASLYYAPCSAQEYISIKDAFIVGLAQGIALLPGVSRLAATYTVARWLSIAPSSAFIFSLEIHLALISAALLKACCDKAALKQFNNIIDVKYIMILGAATIVGLGALILTYKAACNNIFYYFSFYMVIPLLLSLKLDR